MKVCRTDPKDDPAWEAWRLRAANATQSLRADFDKGLAISIDDAIYKGAMPFLKTLFNEKCAYCESPFTAVEPGDVEHYRPKGRVRDDTAKAGELPDGYHRGYWWLAYEWTNLLPSCTDCNRRRKHGENRELAGKGDLFPVKNIRAVQPGTECNEEPLLVNPTEEWGDPSKHFEFNEDGRIRAKTEQGTTTLQLLGLNLREALVKQRARRFREAQRALGTWLALVVIAKSATAQDEELREELNSLWEGKTDYGAFARKGLEAFTDELDRRASIHIKFPLHGLA